jgi:hypothetical protein
MTTNMSGVKSNRILQDLWRYTETASWIIFGQFVARVANREPFIVIHTNFIWHIIYLAGKLAMDTKGQERLYRHISCPALPCPKPSWCPFSNPLSKKEKKQSEGCLRSQGRKGTQKREKKINALSQTLTRGSHGSRHLSSWHPLSIVLHVMPSSRRASWCATRRPLTDPMTTYPNTYTERSPILDTV